MVAQASRLDKPTRQLEFLTIAGMAGLVGLAGFYWWLVHAAGSWRIAAVFWVAAWYEVPLSVPAAWWMVFVLPFAYGGLMLWDLLLLRAARRDWGLPERRSHPRLVRAAFLALLLAGLSAISLLGDLAALMVGYRHFAGVPGFTPFNPLWGMGLAAALPLPWAIRLWARATSPLAAGEARNVVHQQDPLARPWRCPHCTRTYRGRYLPEPGWRCPQCP